MDASNATVDAADATVDASDATEDAIEDASDATEDAIGWMPQCHSGAGKHAKGAALGLVDAAAVDVGWIGLDPWKQQCACGGIWCVVCGQGHGRQTWWRCMGSFARIWAI